MRGHRKPTVYLWEGIWVTGEDVWSIRTKCPWVSASLGSSIGGWTYNARSLVVKSDLCMVDFEVDTSGMCRDQHGT